ncbi:hypothetical protein RhiirA4_481385, partial [Rhizophagus irregularis]
MENLEENSRSLTSANEKIDDFIREMNGLHDDSIFKWIPYNQFSNIKKIGNSDFAVAKWKHNQGDLTVNLKYLYNSQSITIYELHNKAKQYSISRYYYSICKIYGISQNPDTKDYIFVLQDGHHCEKCGEEYIDIWYKWCKPCQIKNLRENFKNWTSGNEKIDNFIEEMQLKVNSPHDIIFEWIPYDQFSDIKKIGNIIYSALWNDGKLEYDRNKKEWTRVQVEINLKPCNSRNTIDEFLNKVVEYKNDNLKIYGISQNSDTKNYILALQTGYLCEECGEKYAKIWCKWCEPCQIKNLSENFKNWTSGNEKIDNFVQEMQLKINKPKDIIFEWISYNQFNDIKEINNTMYSALWNDGQLKYDRNKKEWTRVQ